MRESLSKSPKTKANAGVKSSISVTKAKSAPVARTRISASTRVATNKPLKAKNVKAAKPNKPAKPGKLVKKSSPKPVKALKTSKIKVQSKKPVMAKKTTRGVKVTARIRATPKARSGAKVRTAKTESRSKRKVSLPLVVAPPEIRQEAPRRQLPSAVLRAFEQAVKVFNRRQFDDAKTLFEGIQTRFPTEMDINARAQMYIQVCKQKLENAAKAPRNADELYDRGVFALNIGDFSQARSFFEKALRLRPDEPHLLYSLAATHAQTGSMDQALDYLKRTIQLQPRFRAQALNDADFSGLRENKQFLELLGLTSPFERLESRK